LALITVLSCTFYFDDIHRPPYSILFPYTTLFRSILGLFIRYFVVFEQAGKVVEVSFMEYQHGFPRDTAANKSLANAMNYIIGSLAIEGLQRHCNISWVEHTDMRNR